MLTKLLHLILCLAFFLTPLINPRLIYAAPPNPDLIASHQHQVGGDLRLANHAATGQLRFVGASLERPIPQAYGFEEPNYDGGVVEYSTDRGATWQDAGPLFDGNGYDGSLSSGNPLGGRSAFLHDSHGYIASRLDLNRLANQQVRFRWRVATDSSVYSAGWWLDDVQIYTCTSGQATLSVTTSGAGAGRVFSEPTGIDCGESCTATYASGTTVTLHAEAAAGSTMAGWSAPCAGTTAASCIITLDGDSTVDVVFEPLMHDVTVMRSGSGTGTVSSTPPGLQCGVQCSTTVVAGTIMTLTATADATSRFEAWSGACLGTDNQCVLTVDASKEVTATFVQQVPDLVNLTVHKQGEGEGRILSPAGGIDCNGDCNHAFPIGTTVQLHAEAGADATFQGWSGACNGMGSCEIVMDGDKQVAATFAGRAYSLTIMTAGAGKGTVTIDETDSRCPPNCRRDYPANTTVTLHAENNPWAELIGWSSNCTPQREGSNSCTVILDASKTVTATFQELYPLWLPPILDRWPPIPDAPTLNPIPAPANGAFTITWQRARHAEDYELEEATEPTFGTPTVVYRGPALTWLATNKPTGRYYYRIRARTRRTQGGWSATRSVALLPPTTFYPLADTTILENSPKLNVGKTVDMWAGYDVTACHPAFPGQQRARSLLQFDLSTVPVDLAITKATLHAELVLACFRMDQLGQSSMIDVKPITTPWNEADVTWDSQPLLGETFGSIEIPLRSDLLKPYQVDVTPLVQQWLQNSATNQGLALIGPEASDRSAAIFGFATREWRGTGLDPHLEITYAIASAAATQEEQIEPQPAIHCEEQASDMLLCTATVGTDNVAESHTIRAELAP